MNQEGCAIDLALLSHDQLQRPHQKAKTEGGRELMISLERGQNLYCGAVLYREEGLIIAVDMPEEKVFEIRPRTTMEWAKAAFNIGNMHQSAYLYPDCIRIPYDYVLENMVKALGVEYAVTEKKLDGMRPNVSPGHSHHHDHEHDHGHDHKHGH